MMKQYTALFRIRFSNTLQYRAAALAGIVTQFAWGFMELFAFSAFYKANPAAFPMEFSQIVSYIWLQQAFLALFMMWFWDNDIITSVTSGSIAYELVRPMNLYNKWFVSSSASRLAKATLRCFPILLIAFLVPEPYRMSLPKDLTQFTLFIVSAALSLGVVVSFAMLIYISLFYTTSPTGIKIMTAIAADFLSGSVVPIPFFPQPLRTIAEFLPFASMQNMPLRIYSGNILGTEAVIGIALQLAWLIIMVTLGKILMKKSLKKVVVQGG